MRLRYARNARLTRKVKNIMRYKQIAAAPADFVKREITTTFVSENSALRGSFVGVQTLRLCYKMTNFGAINRLLK